MRSERRSERTEGGEREKERKREREREREIGDPLPEVYNPHML